MKKSDFKKLLKNLKEAKYCRNVEKLWDKKIDKTVDETKRFKSVKEINEYFKSKWYQRLQYYLFYCWWNIITDLKWKIPNLLQRAYYGVGYADIWNFDEYLNKVILRGLKELKKNKFGLPTDIYNKYNSRKNLNQKQKDKLALKEWQKKLNTMIEGFESNERLVQGNFVIPNKVTFEKLEKKFQEGMKLFNKYYNSLWN
jgi:hypothetical protein